MRQVLFALAFACGCGGGSSSDMREADMHEADMAVVDAKAGVDAAACASYPATGYSATSPNPSSCPCAPPTGACSPNTCTVCLYSGGLTNCYCNAGTWQCKGDEPDLGL